MSRMSDCLDPSQEPRSSDQNTEALLLRASESLGVNEVYIYFIMIDEVFRQLS